MKKLAALVAIVFACGCGDSKKADNKQAKSPAAANKTHYNKGDSTATLNRKPKRKRLARRKKRKARHKLPKQYWQLLRQGRAQQRKGKHAEAIASFDKGLTVVPDNAQLLAEISWAALHGKKYDRAISAAKKALALASRNTIKAQALYNLGRTYQAQGKKQEALRAYHRSQILRPHKAVASHIKELAGKAPGLIVTPLPAAAATVRPKFDLNESWGVMLKKAAKPFVAAFVQENDDGECDLYMRVGRQWLVVHKVADCPGNNKYWRTSVELSMTVVAQRALLRLNIEEGERNYRTTKQGKKLWTTKLNHAVMFCGVGKSKEVSCTPRIVVRRSVTQETAGAKPKVSEERSLKLADEKLLVTDKGKTVEYALTFR